MNAQPQSQYYERYLYDPKDAYAGMKPNGHYPISSKTGHKYLDRARFSPSGKKINVRPAEEFAYSMQIKRAAKKFRRQAASQLGYIPQEYASNISFAKKIGMFLRRIF